MIHIEDFISKDCYLVKTTKEHVLGFTKTELDISKLPDATIIAVGLDRSLWLFYVKPPSHNVELYAFSSGNKHTCSNQDLLDFIHTKSLAWAEL